MSNEEKRINGLMLSRKIDDCKTEDELEVVEDLIDEYMAAGAIFKYVYKFLKNEALDNQLNWLIERGII